MNAATIAAAVVLGAAAGTLVWAGRSLRRVRHDRLRAQVRPILFSALDRGEIDLGVIDSLGTGQQRALHAQARALLPNLRGSDRETLAYLLDHAGAVEDARRRTRSHRASTRAEAGTFLGHAGSPSGVPDLVALLRDTDPEVRWAAARGLGRIGHVSAVPPLLSALEGRHPLPIDLVIDAVSAIRDTPVSLLRQGLRSRSAPTRAATVELLGRFQAVAATSDIIEVLGNDPSMEVRARAARALGRIGSPRSVNSLLGCLMAGAPAVQVQAIWALGEVGADDAVPALRTMLVGPSRPMSDASARALARITPLGPGILARIAEGEGYPAESARLVLAEISGRVASSGAR